MLILLIFAGGCTKPPAKINLTPTMPTIFLTPDYDPVITPSPHKPEVITQQPIFIKPLPTPTNSPESNINSINLPCNDPVCYQVYNGILSIPIPEEGIQTIDPTYRYGATQLGERPPHVGVEFYNSTGTSVLAAQDGIVTFAGNDHEKLWGDYSDFYGNLIIIKHEISDYSFPIYTLYAHLSKIDVNERDYIKSGQQIGEVGATGSAIGSHLHFEVRIGNPDKNSIQNPELFLKLIPTDSEQKTGILIGSVTYRGVNIISQNLVIQEIIDEQLTTNSSLFLETYANGIPSNPLYNENFIVSNLPAGKYRLSVFIEGKFFEQVFFIKENTKTIININSEE